MSSLAKSSAGTTFSVCATLPSTYDAAGFGALSYTAVAEVTDMGQVGKVYSKVTHNPVGDRKTYKLRGSYDNGTIALKMARAFTDGGQTLLVAAAASDIAYSYKIQLQGSGTILYFTALALSLVTVVSTVNTITAADLSLEINSDICEV